MKTKKAEKIIKVILILSIVAYTVKNLFVGMDVDEGYGIVIGYRLAMGDKMLLHMWEPHQTSAIFTAVFIKIWLFLTGGSFDFLDLYLKVVFFIIHGMITYFIYKTLKKCIGGMSGNMALLVSLIFYVTSPKSIFIPEYSNLHMWFFIMLAMSLIRYFCKIHEDSGRGKWIILAGLFLTGDVLAYPSMVLLLPVCILIIANKSENRAKDIIAFILPCLISLIVFMSYIFSYLSIEQMFEFIPYVISDGSHQISAMKRMQEVFVELGIMLLISAISLAAAYFISIPVVKSVEGKRDIKVQKDVRVAICIGIFAGILFLIQIIAIFVSIYAANYPHIAYMAISLLGIYFYIKGSAKEQCGFWLTVLSMVSYFCILLLSNWKPMNLNIYMVGGVIGGLLCIFSYYKDKGGMCGEYLIKSICVIMILVNTFGYCYLIIGGEEAHSPIYTVGGYGHGGIRAGIFGSWMSSYRYNSNMEVWAEAIPEESVVFYAGQSQYFYMLGKNKIASPNTISSPEYDETILEYWKINPDRYPDVVVFEGWYGDLPHYGEDSFIMKWVENEFGYTHKEEYPYITVFYR